MIMMHFIATVIIEEEQFVVETGGEWPSGDGEYHLKFKMELLLSLNH